MTDSRTKSVKMTFPALYNYILTTNYRCFSGYLCFLLSLGALVILVIGWDEMFVNQRVVFLLVGLAFTVFNPLMLAFKAFQQLKLSPSYKKPLDFTFGESGITVSQGELSQKIEWDKICKIILNKKIFAIYTSRLHAFVIPVSELGEDKGKIITTVVQFTAGNNPQISGNLKRYISGKGI